MSISAIGNISINTNNYLNTPISASIVDPKVENIASVTTDNFHTSLPEEAINSDLAQIMKAIHSSGIEEKALSLESPTLDEPSINCSTSQCANVDSIEVPNSETTCEDIASYCVQIAKSESSIEERTELISKALCLGVEKTESPNVEWVRATPEQIKLYVQETLEHVDAVRQIGKLRGLNFDDHDLEVGTGKFEPQIAQYLALPGREDSVQWSITKHNASPHHHIWKDPDASVDDLAESASDIVNAWRMNRRVYNKPSWSWERIADVIDAQYQNNQLSENQRTAILEAIPYQMAWEEQYGIPS